MINIEMGKVYINGHNEKVRIVAVDRVDELYPVVGLVTDRSDCSERMECYTKNGKFYSHKGDDDEDLREYNPAMDFVVDQPIWVRNYQLDKWVPRHFVEYKDGQVWTFREGRTSHSCDPNDKVKWNFYTTEKPIV